jgi:AraC family transcriptional regulator of adaptative response/methylated-DNA-[protein]-cysteine methyltransferase
MLVMPVREMEQDWPVLDDDMCWQAVQTRDATQDGRFVYAVRSTGVYCRPSCPSRRPRRERVRFFVSPSTAELEGFRPCRRCRPAALVPVDPLVPQVVAACRYIAAHLDEQLTLARIGAIVGLSPAHLQRVFVRLLGVSPRAYADALRLGELKLQLRSGTSVSTAIAEAGYGSLSRIYERTHAQLGMTPGAYRRGGTGMQIGYTIVDCPLGLVLVAATDRGICAVSLGSVSADLEAELHADYPRAQVVRDDAALATAATALQEYLRGERLQVALPLDIQATAFQRRVWEALQHIPYGETRTYKQIAEDLGNPAAVRAVGRACATNPVSLVVPCHRAIGSDGKLHGYRWGLERKQALLELEQQNGSVQLTKSDA